MKPSAEHGITLVELLVAVAAFAIVSLVAFGVLSTSRQSASMNDQTVQIQQNVRLAMDLIARDVRMAGFGYPSAGSVPGCTNHINASVQSAGPPFVPGDNAVGADAGADSIRIVTVDQQVGTLAADYVSGNTFVVNNLASDINTGQVLTIEGVFTGSVNAFTLGSPGSVQLNRTISAPTAFQAGATVLRLACVTYSVTGPDVTPTFQLLRQVNLNSAVPVVDGIESLQFAYGIDTNNDGTLDDQNASGTVDCKDFIPNDTATNGQCAGPAGGVGTLPASINAIPTSVRQVRITVVGRSIPPAAANIAGNCWRDPSFKGSAAVQAEDQLLSEPVNSCGVQGGIRRRTLTRIVTLRNGSNI